MRYLKLFEEHSLYNRLPEGFFLIKVDYSNEIIITDKNYKVLSSIQFNKINNGIYYVGGAASTIRGLGTLSYEFAMMSIYPNGLMPSRDGDVRGGSFDIWERFYDRDDIEKNTLDISDDIYQLEILYGDNIDMTPTEKQEWFDDGGDSVLPDNGFKTLNIFNTVYKYKPNKTYNDNILNYNQLDDINRTNIKSQLDDFFINKYME